MNDLLTLAYVDPGVGLLAWQAAVAFVVGLIFYLRKTREFILAQARRLKGLVRRDNGQIRESKGSQTTVVTEL